MNELIQYKDVEICQDEQIVLTDVNLTISSGELVYLLGRVGTGKSSFMKTIYGELPVDGTEATALDYDLLKLRRKDIPYLRRKVGVVFQDFQLLVDRNVEENLMFVLLLVKRVINMIQKEICLSIEKKKVIILKD